MEKFHASIHTLLFFYPVILDYSKAFLLIQNSFIFSHREFFFFNVSVFLVDG